MSSKVLIPTQEIQLFEVLSTVALQIYADICMSALAWILLQTLNQSVLKDSLFVVLLKAWLCNVQRIDLAVPMWYLKRKQSTLNHWWSRNWLTTVTNLTYASPSLRRTVFPYIKQVKSTLFCFSKVVCFCSNSHIDKRWQFPLWFLLFKQNFKKSGCLEAALRRLWSFGRFLNFCQTGKSEVALGKGLWWQIWTLV